MGADGDDQLLDRVHPFPVDLGDHVILAQAGISGRPSAVDGGQDDTVVPLGLLHAGAEYRIGGLAILINNWPISTAWLIGMAKPSPMP